MGLMGVKGWEIVFRGERLKADLVAAVLEANGITVEVFGDHAYSAAMNFSEARIMVPDADAARALELIRQGEDKPPDEV
jgi:aspartokinase